MTSFRMRPRFEIATEDSADEFLQKIKVHLKQNDDPFDCSVMPGHFYLKVKKEDQHYWSPQLNLSFDEDSDPLLIRGRYEPHPNVWTLFILLYLALSVLILFIGIIGLSRMSLGMSAKILWVVPVLALAAAVLYFVSQIGQKLGAEDTFSLHHFLEEVVGEKVHIN